MPESVTNDLLYEVLKKIEHTTTRMDAKLDNHSRQFIGLREQCRDASCRSR
jgi:hypothetical protein